VIVVVWALVSYEAIRWLDFRDRARHGCLA
jgi:hypothetical protein